MVPTTVGRDGDMVCTVVDRESVLGSLDTIVLLGIAVGAIMRQRSSATTIFGLVTALGVMYCLQWLLRRPFNVHNLKPKLIIA